MILRAASVIGREHLRLGTNNQDGACVMRSSSQGVAVVTDGCSSQPFSEVGARLGARVLASRVCNLEGVSLSNLPRMAMDALVEWIAGFARGAGPEAELEVIEQYGLFTVLCAVQRGSESVVFGVGDGSLLIGEQLIRLSSGEDNAPSYAAYRLCGRPVETAVHYCGPSTLIALATDGLDPWLNRDTTALERLLNEPLLKKNPVHLQRSLNVLSRTERFFDDATVAMLDGRGAS